jgi:putative redox protein
MRTERFDFTGAAGQAMAGRLDLPEGAPQGFALFAHCFTCTKLSLAAVRIARALTLRGLGVLRFDFTGLGESEGDFADSSFSGDVRDLVAAARAMTARGYPPTLLVGHSLGGAAALAAAVELREVAAVAVIGAPFDVAHVARLFADELKTIREQGEAKVDLGGRPFTIRRSFVEDLEAQDQGARIAALRRPLLILHSPRDQIVGVENAAAIFQAARHPKSFVSLDDADHLLTRGADADYAAGVIAAWGARYLPAAAAAAPPEMPEGHVVVAETGAGRFQVEVAVGKTRFLADAPVAVGGLGSGPGPYDLLSAALGACTAMTLRLYAEPKKWPLARVSVDVTHEKRQDRTLPDLFTRAIALEGALDAAQRARLIEIAERCPVHRTLTRGATIATVAAGEAPAATGDGGAHARDMAETCAQHP